MVQLVQLVQVLMLALVLLLSGHSRCRSTAIVYLLFPVKKVDRMRHFENGTAEWQVRLRSARLSSSARELELPLLSIDFSSSPVWNIARYLVSCITKTVGSTRRFAKEHIGRGRCSSASSSCSTSRTGTAATRTGSTA